MPRWESMVAHTVVCLLTAGCAAEGVEREWPEQGAIAGAASPEIDVTAQALDSTWAKRYTVSGNQSVAMDSISTHVCVLTRVAGSFQGWGESVRVERNSVQYILTSKTMQPGVSAEAHCFALNKFVSDDNSRVQAYFNGSAWSTCWSNGCREKTDNFFNWRLSTFVNGIGGKWDRSCEFVRVSQVYSGYTPVTIASGTSCDVPTNAWYDAVPIGSGNIPAKYLRMGTAIPSRPISSTGRAAKCWARPRASCVTSPKSAATSTAPVSSCSSGPRLYRASRNGS